MPNWSGAVSREIYVGEKVKNSPMGAGIFTDVTDAGYPRVDHVAVTWMVMDDGEIYNPLNREITEQTK